MRWYYYPPRSVDPFLSLFEKNDVVSYDTEWLNNYVFNVWEVDCTPELPGGRDEVRNRMRQLYAQQTPFNIDELMNYQPFATANFFVNMQGEATFNGLTRKSDIVAVDDWIEQVCVELCKERFTPAMVRGRFVNCEYSTSFIKYDLIGKK